jgi:plastocyanin
MDTSRREFLVATALWLAASAALANAAELPTFQLTARDGRFQPETLEVPAGQRIKIVIRNEGPGAIEFEMLSPFRERVLGPGGQSFVIFAPLKPGTYQFFDEFHPDTGKGQIIAR